MPYNVTYPTAANNLTQGVQIVIGNICPNAICVAPVNLSVLLTSGIMNPNAVIKITGNFVIETL